MSGGGIRRSDGGPKPLVPPAPQEVKPKADAPVSNSGQTAKTETAKPPVQTGAPVAPSKPPVLPADQSVKVKDASFRDSAQTSAPSKTPSAPVDTQTKKKAESAELSGFGIPSPPPKSGVSAPVKTGGPVATQATASASATQAPAQVAAPQVQTANPQTVQKSVNQFVQGLPPAASQTFHATQSQNLQACMKREALDGLLGKDQDFCKSVMRHSGKTAEVLAMQDNPKAKAPGVFQQLIHPATEKQLEDGGKDVVAMKYRALDAIAGLSKAGGNREAVAADVASVLKDTKLDTFEKKVGALEDTLKKKEAANDALVPKSFWFKPSPSEVKTLKDNIDSVAWLSNRSGGALTQKGLWDQVSQSASAKEAFAKLDTHVQVKTGWIDNKVATFQGTGDTRSAVLAASTGTASVAPPPVRVPNAVDTVQHQTNVSRVTSTETLQPASLVSKDSPVYKDLAGLETRLKDGDKSLIGGSAYAEARFPKEVLHNVLEGKTKVLVFDGPEAQALDFAQKKMVPSDSGQHMVTKLQGLDGSGTRLLVTNPKGEQCMILAGLGPSRQVHNAGSLLTYSEQGADGKTKHVPLQNVTLAKSDSYNSEAVFKKSIDKALTSLPKLLTEKPGNPDEAKAQESLQKFLGPNPEAKLAEVQNGKTTLCMHFVPQQLAELGPDKVCFLKNRAMADGIPVNVALYKHDDGRISQILMPKAGGSAGVYGETAGDFTKAFFSGLGDKANPHVLFNGTAGGFQGTEGAVKGKQGFGVINPGGLMTPVGQFVDPTGVKNLPVDSLITRNPALKDELTGGKYGIRTNSDHTAVMAPAVETQGQMTELTKKGVSSVDVEALPIRRAVEAQPGATFTPIYTHSDDPMHCVKPGGENASLARMGPFFEGGTTNKDLQAALGRLIDTANPPIAK